MYKCRMGNSWWVFEDEVKEVLRKSQTIWIISVCIYKQQQQDNVTHMRCSTPQNSPQACIRLFYKEDDDPLLFMPTEDKIKYFA